MRLGHAAHALIVACIVGAGSIGMSGPARAADCQNTPEGRVCKVQQPITAGTVVDTDRQRELGLVTVNGGCSGTLITQFLVLTARHCVTHNSKVNGTIRNPADITVTAAWAPSVTARVYRLQDFKKNTAPNDIILVRLGFPNFGQVNAQRVYATSVRSGSSVKLSGQLKDTDTVTQYGRGYSTFGSGTYGTSSAVGSTGLGTYRSAQFKPSLIGDTHYTLAMNSSSQVGHGGDSGGPSWVTVDGFNEGIAGVQSTCTRTDNIAGTPANQAENWKWATGITECQYVSTGPYLAEIADAKREVPPDYTGTCKEHAARQFARVTEARGLACPFLSSGGWNKSQDEFEKTCLNFGDGAASTNKENERGLQANLDSCKAKGSAGKAGTESTAEAPTERGATGTRAAEVLVEPGTNRGGSDYRNFEVGDADLRDQPELNCQAACQKEGQCKAWTYVKAGVQGPKGRCWLKTAVPAAQANNCCVSGVTTGVEPGINRGGNDYRNFEIAGATPQPEMACRAACQKEGQCKAWTLVKPGVQGPNGRCWLKTAVPVASVNNCCTSGSR
jgi:PAN domain/Trypsin